MRLLAALAAAAASLALTAGAALGADYRVDLWQAGYAPATPTDVSVEVGLDEGVPLPSTIDILMPAGYGLDATLAPGTVVTKGGLLVVDAVARSMAITVPVTDLPVPMTMTVAEPAAAAACTGGDLPALAFRLDFDLSEARLRIPAPFSTQVPERLTTYGYVEPAVGADLAAGYGHRLRACFPDVSIDPIAYQGLTFTVSVLMTGLGATFTGLFTTPPTVRASTWSMLFAAWNDQRTGPDPQRVVESRAVVGLSNLLTLGVVGKKTVRPRANVRVRGSLLGDLVGGGKKVTILKGATRTALATAATATTLPTGAFGYTTRAPRKGKLFFLAAFGPARLDVTPTACTAPHPEATLGCTSATLGGITSRLVSVTVKRR